MLRMLVHRPMLVSDVGYPKGSNDTRASRARRSRPDRLAGDTGQTTAEYALVLLGAAAIAALMIAWASESGAIGELFDAVLSHVIGSVT
jgi:hypothetical protein